MDEVALAGSGDATKKGRFRMGMKGLMGAVASCALIIWAGLSIRDQLQGHQSLRVIRAGNAVERRTAAQDLWDEPGIDSEAAMAALIHALGDGDTGVRATSAKSLGNLVYRLRSQPRRAPVASDPLKRRIDVATRALVPLLSDQDPGVRAAAATGLGTMPWGPSREEQPPPKQLAALLDASNAVRRQAAKMIYGSPLVTLPPELVAALKDESAEVRAAAARALARFGPDLDPEIPALLAMMERDETDVRKACGGALQAAWPTPAVVPTLIGFLKSRDHVVRIHAALLLGRIGPEASVAIPALIAVLNEPFDAAYYPDPAREAARALGQMSPTREAIAALVAVISPEKVERNLASFPKPGETGSPPSDVPARKALRIMSAMEALGRIGPPAVAAVPALIAAYRMALRTNHSMAATAIPKALARTAPNSAGAPDAVSVLIRSLDSKGPAFQMGAIEALASFGSDAAQAIPKLRVLHEDSDNLVRNAAAKTIAAIEVQTKPDPGANIGP